MERLSILIWHIHGTYLHTITQLEHQWYLPTRPGAPEGYGGRGSTFDWPAWVHEVPAEAVRDLDLDLIIYQTPQNYFTDRQEILSDAQRRLPGIYLEHNTPRPHPWDSRHPVADEDVLLVHVTQFNRLMWDNGATPTRVIEHSTPLDPTLRYVGDRASGITMVNHIDRRGRMVGWDLFQAARAQVPLALAGMGSGALGGLGDIPYRDLHREVARYRFLFSPMRYTSLPLAVIEAMTLGMPIVALATTEVPNVMHDGEVGYISCDPDYLLAGMRHLLAEPEAARAMGASARKLALERFGMDRFKREWNAAFAAVRGARP